MKHKQKGYDSVQQETPITGKVFEAKLYNTTVLSYKANEGRLVFKHGGWITPSTTKAINGALTELGLDNLYRAKIKTKVMFIEVLEGRSVVDQFLVNK